MRMNIQYESKNFIPRGFLKFSPNGWELLSKILLAYWMFISMANYKILTNYLLNLTTLCHIKCNRRVNFHFALYRLHRKGWMATKFTRLQPTCLSCVGCSALAFHKLHSKLKTFPELKSALQQIWDDLQQTTINKLINDFRKHLNACISPVGGHF